MTLPEELTHKLFEVSPAGRFVDTATEILRRTQVGPKGPLGSLDSVWPDGKEYLLANITTEVLSPEALGLLGYENSHPESLKKAFESFISSAKKRLEAAQSSKNPLVISQAERDIAREVRQIISAIPYVGSVDYPVAMVNKKALNCVGAQYLGSYLLDKIGLTYLMAEVPGHSVHLLVTTSDRKVFFQDMLNADTDVNLTEAKIVEDGKVVELADLAINQVGDGVITFTIKAPELEGMQKQLLPRQGQQFVCRAYSGEIGYSLQLLYNLSLKFNKPEWVMSFSQIGLLISSEHVPLKVRLGNAVEILQGVEEAKLLYEEALKVEPNVADNHRRLGRVNFELGDNQKAINCYDKALEITPTDGSLWTSKGRVYESSGETDLAVAAYRKAFEIDPRLLTPRIDLIKMLLIKGENVEATSLALQALNQEAYSSYAYIHLAQFFEVHFPVFADQAYQKAIESREKKNSQPLIKYAEFLAKGGKIDAAKPYFETALLEDPGRIYNYLEFAESLESAGQLEESKAVLLRALKAPYKNHETLIADDMLEIFVDMEEFAEIYHWVVFPTNDFMFSRISDILAKAGDNQNSVKALQNAIDINPYSEFHYHKLGKMAEKNGDFNAARLAYEKALKLKPELISAVVSLATLLKQQNLADEALELIRQSVRVAELGHEIFTDGRLADLANLSLEMGDDRLAGDVYMRALDITLNHGLAVEIGNAVKEADPQLAEKAYRKALEIEPGYVWAVYLLCDLLVASGQEAAAIKEIQKFVDQNLPYSGVMSDAALQHLAELCMKLKLADLGTNLYSITIKETDNPYRAAEIGNAVKEADPQLAEKAYRKALEIAPSYSLAAAQLADLLLLNKNFNEALDVIVMCISSPDQSRTLNDLSMEKIARICIEINRTDLALRAYAKTIEVTQNTFRAEHCGDMLRELDKNLAEKAYRKALELDQTRVRVVEKLESLLEHK